MKNPLFLPLIICSLLIAQEPDNEQHARFNKKIFSIIYERNSWGDNESRSGSGSSMLKTKTIRRIIPKICQKLHIKSILDAPCGDFNWMKTVSLPSDTTYIGLDIVDNLIAANNRHYGSDKRFFLVADLVTNPLPKVDLIICRDCIQHLPEINAINLIKNIKKSGSKFLFTSTYPRTSENSELGNFYSVARISYRNMRIVPFNFPEPIIIIDEGFDNKTMALWRISDLPDY